MTKLISLYIIPGVLNAVSARDLIIDDRTSGTHRSNLGTEWQLIAGQVMGGVYDDELALDNFKKRNCLWMRGGRLHRARDPGCISAAHDSAADAAQ